MDKKTFGINKSYYIKKKRITLKLTRRKLARDATRTLVLVSEKVENVGHVGCLRFDIFKKTFGFSLFIFPWKSQRTMLTLAPVADAEEAVVVITRKGPCQTGRCWWNHIHFQSDWGMQRLRLLRWTSFRHKWANSPFDVAVRFLVFKRFFAGTFAIVFQFSFVTNYQPCWFRQRKCVNVNIVLVV